MTAPDPAATSLDAVEQAAPEPPAPAAIPVQPSAEDAGDGAALLAQLAEAHALAARVPELEQHAALAEDLLTRLRVPHEAGLEDTFAERLRGADETELTADATVLTELLAAARTATPARAGLDDAWVGEPFDAVDAQEVALRPVVVARGCSARSSMTIRLTGIMACVGRSVAGPHRYARQVRVIVIAMMAARSDRVLRQYKSSTAVPERSPGSFLRSARTQRPSGSPLAPPSTMERHDRRTPSQDSGPGKADRSS
ncbi:hypothetical protein [Nocardia sp. NRRL S-836]|uniref:hypothetical protein n=1 Tax=Nocardia sp. NRRL S-836 TaxID=1519492 RepID=UPI0006AD9CBB|nr:hypothetical protein [Nocardia sp. NRRL S-836]